MDHEVRITADGSSTLYSNIVKDTYHSSFGAIQESQYIFIEQGLLRVAANKNIKILEVGFGTGLNALLTYKKASENKFFVDYTAVEPFLISKKILSDLNFTEILDIDELDNIFSDLHSTNPGEKCAISSYFSFTLINKNIQDVELKSEKFDLIYFDAFGPEAQPEMWTSDIFDKMFKLLKNNGILVTFSSKGLVKRNLRSAGFKVKRLAGPPGKRHMVLAVREA